MSCITIALRIIATIGNAHSGSICSLTINGRHENINQNARLVLKYQKQFDMASIMLAQQWRTKQKMVLLQSRWMIRPMATVCFHFWKPAIHKIDIEKQKARSTLPCTFGCRYHPDVQTFLIFDLVALHLKARLDWYLELFGGIEVVCVTYSLARKLNFSINFSRIKMVELKRLFKKDKLQKGAHSVDSN